MGLAMLLEREHELGALDAAVADATAGRGRALALSGPAGIGKSALLAAASSPVDGLVLSARGIEVEQEYPFGAVRQLFGSVVRTASGARRDAMFAGAAGAARHLFEPDVATHTPAQQASFATLHGLFWLLAGLTDSGAVRLIVDDCHWLDAPSIRFLEFLLPRAEELPLLLLLGTRPSGTARMTTPADRLLASPDLEVLELKPLSAAGVGALVSDWFEKPADPKLVAACADVTGGNPFYLTALLRELSEHRPRTRLSAVHRLGPRAVVAAAIRRLGRNLEDAIALAQAVAVLGDDADLGLAARLAELELADARAAAASLTGAEIFADTPAPRFAHPILRSAFSADLNAREREDAHGRAAELLAAAGSPDERVATHLLIAAPAGDARTVEILRRAADAALAEGAPDVAADLLARALREPPPDDLRARLMLELGIAEGMAARPGAVDHLTSAFADAGDAATQIAAAEPALMHLISHHRREEALILLERVRRSGNVEGERLLDARFAAIVMASLPDGGPVARERLSVHGEEFAALTLTDRLLLCHGANLRAWRSDDAARSAELARRALAGLDLEHEPRFMAMDFSAASYPLIFAERSGDAADLIARVIARARQWGSAWDYAQAVYQRGLLAWCRGAIDEAETDVRASWEMAQGSGVAMALASTASTLILTLIEQDELDEAERVLIGTECAEGPMPDSPVFLLLLCARGRLRRVRGDIDGALADLHDAQMRACAAELLNPIWAPWRTDAALAHLARGEATEAERIAAGAVALARRWGTPGAIGAAERLAGVVVSGGAGIQRLEAAAGLLRDSECRLEYARSLIELGAAYRRANRRAAARDPLRAGAELAERCGATALHRLAVDELTATGARLRRSTLTGPGALTPSERRVVALAAEGMSNSEIAQALFVTRKTVEKHLGAAYAKLEISSRAQLPRAIA